MKLFFLRNLSDKLFTMSDINPVGNANDDPSWKQNLTSSHDGENMIVEYDESLWGEVDVADHNNKKARDEEDKKWEQRINEVFPFSNQDKNGQTEFIHDIHMDYHHDKDDFSNKNREDEEIHKDHELLTQEEKKKKKIKLVHKENNVSGVGFNPEGQFYIFNGEDFVDGEEDKNGASTNKDKVEVANEWGDAHLDPNDDKKKKESNRGGGTGKGVIDP